jgi:anti-sigma regulatory factor (Ser/Thr protein kinase)
MNAAEVAKSEMRVFLGARSQIRGVRAFVAEALISCPVADDVVLLASEVAGNAVLHTASGRGGTFTVVVVPDAGRVRVEVHDDGGSDSAPGTRMAKIPDESGRGLNLVEQLATQWGHLGGRNGRVVWLELAW